jgi:hypothetical protein
LILGFILLFYPLKGLLKLFKLVWEDIGLWDKVEISLAVLVLHPFDIYGQPVFPGEFVGVGEVVDLLVRG